MAMISEARSGLSIRAYPIPFSSQTMHTAHVYVDRAEPIISGFGIARPRIVWSRSPLRDSKRLQPAASIYSRKNFRSGRTSASGQTPTAAESKDKVSLFDHLVRSCEQ